MNRRELLRTLSVMGALVALPPQFGSDIDPAQTADPGSIDQYEQMNAGLWSVYTLSPSKRAVYPLVSQQVGVLTSALQRTHSENSRRRLCALASDVLQLAGEIHFDGNHYTEAAHCYTLAADAGKEAGDYDLWACALTRHAFVGMYERSFTRTAPLLAAASQAARRGDGDLSTRHWVAAVQAELFAELGDLDACGRALDTAEAVHELKGRSHNGGWLRFDGSRLAEQRGTCFMRLGRYDLAESALTDALAQQLSPRRRGSVLIDMAGLGIERRDHDAVLEYGGAAVELARRTGSGYIGRKLHEFQGRLDRLGADNRTKELGDRITALSQVGQP